MKIGLRKSIILYIFSLNGNSKINPIFDIYKNIINTTLSDDNYEENNIDIINNININIVKNTEGNTNDDISLNIPSVNNNPKSNKSNTYNLLPKSVINTEGFKTKTFNNISESDVKEYKKMENKEKCSRCCLFKPLYDCLKWKDGYICKNCLRRYDIKPGELQDYDNFASDYEKCSRCYNIKRKCDFIGKKRGEYKMLSTCRKCRLLLKSRYKKH